jgi:Protein of unknown function (DUF2946)
MDDAVKAALAKWPNVPHCYGWLALDARGEWFMRDDRVQAAGPFPTARGSRVLHDKLVGFIERNYASDAQGCWFFQNGPQRVYVELEVAPMVWRVDDAGQLTSHHGMATSAQDCCVDEHGRLFIDTALGLGLVHTMDMHRAAEQVQRGTWVPREVHFGDLPQRFGFVLSPQQRQKTAA